MPTSRRAPRARKTSRRTSRSSGSSSKPTKRSPSDGFRPALEAAARALSGRRWYLFGAQAVLLYGAPRLTGDIDITVEEPQRPRDVIEALERAGFELKEVGDVDDFVSVTRILPFVHPATDVGLDVVFSGPGLEDAFHARARTVALGKTRLRVIDVNDLITLKLLAARPKDLEDVRALVRVRPAGLDREKVQATLLELQRAIDMSDLLPRLDACWPC